MKKFIVIIFSILLLSVFTACGSSKGLDVGKLEVSTYKSSEQTPDVDLSVKENNLTGDIEKITLIFTNRSTNEYTYGIDPILEVEVDGTWYVMPLLDNAAWNDIGYMLSPEDTREDSFDIKSYYGPLAAGKYRIVKRLYLDGEQHFAVGEFEVK